MRKLLLIRHAKSSWEEAALNDFDRPLNKRGKRDAPFMGNILYKQGVQPDMIISSPAKRAYSTAKKIAKALTYPVEKIEKYKSLYLGSPSELLKVIGKQQANIQTLLLFGHNPEITELVARLCNQPVENVPTCGIVCISFNVQDWRSINKSNSKFEYFDYPKNYKHAAGE